MDWLSLRELDEAARRPKGTAFRAFKALQGQLQEGRDFRLLEAAHDAQEIGRLRDAGRLYPSSRNVLLFPPKTAALVREKMR